MINHDIIKKVILMPVICYSTLSVVIAAENSNGSIMDNNKSSYSQLSKHSGWCERLDSSYHWSKDDTYLTKELCLLQNKGGDSSILYRWQTKNAKDSYDGRCLVNKMGDNYSYQYETSKIGCENHDKNGWQPHDWKSDFPTFFVGPSQDGHGYSSNKSIPDFGDGEYNRIEGLMKSYYIPKDWFVRFFTKEDFTGDYYTRSGNSQSDKDDFSVGAKIKSIKIWKRELFTPVNSAKQIYFGVGGMSDNCGENGRLFGQEDINAIGRTVLCGSVRSPWGIWKIQGSDGSDWSFMGYSYNCQSKAGVSLSAPALCAMNDAPLASQVFLFTENNYQGVKAWQGKAEVKKVGDQAENTNVKSFKLGVGAVLTGYSQIDFAGESNIYSTSTARPSFPILSYKLTAS